MYINFLQMQLFKEQTKEITKNLTVIRENLCHEITKLKTINEAEDVILRLESVEKRLEITCVLIVKYGNALSKISDSFKDTEKEIIKQLDSGEASQKQGFSASTIIDINTDFEWKYKLI